MPSAYSAAGLPADCLLDSGLLLINSDTPFGVSMGDLGFDPRKEIRQIDFDGKRSDIVGLDRIVGFQPAISGSLKEMNATKLTSFYEPGSTSAEAGGVTTITPRKAGVLLVAGNYLTDVRLVYPRGSGGYAWIRFPKGLCIKYDVKGKDKEEAIMAIEIVARLDMAVAADTDVAPYVIELAAAL
ncbi:MAG TPA: hypothetical protein VNO75_12395 [Gemmatimonadaceae bacterium]|nr:hypothetical protein [Gemmatimonadaceae bacterium]